MTACRRYFELTFLLRSMKYVCYAMVFSLLAYPFGDHLGRHLHIEGPAWHHVPRRVNPFNILHHMEQHVDPPITRLGSQLLVVDGNMLQLGDVEISDLNVLLPTDISLHICPFPYPVHLVYSPWRDRFAACCTFGPLLLPLVLINGRNNACCFPVRLRA